MNKVKQRFPNFVYVPLEEWVESEFNTLEEFYNIDWIKKWSSDPRFHRFSVRKAQSHFREFSLELMAEQNGGKDFYFIGRIVNSDIDLPTWVRPEGK